MRLKVWMLFLCLAALPVVALAQGAVDGKRTGSVAGGRGGEIPIEEGTIANGMLKFKTKQMGRGGEVTLNWSGTLKGDEIAFTRAQEGGQGQPVEFTLKREK